MARLKGKRVLDVGCGGGMLSEAMARRGAEVPGIDLATKALKVAQLHALEAGTEAVEYREVAAEALARRCRPRSTSSPAWKCSNTCPIRRRSSRACAALVKPGGWLFFSTINRNPKAFSVRHRRRRVPAATAAQGHARIRAPHPAERACRVVPRRRTGTVRTQPRHAYNPSDARYSLPGDTSVNYLVRVPKARNVRGQRAAGASSSTSTARWSTARPTSPAPATRCALHARARAVAATSSCARWSDRARAAWSQRRFRRRRRTPEFDALRDEFLDRYEAPHDARDPPLRRRAAGARRRWMRPALRWGIVTNKSTRFAVPLVQGWVWPSRAASLVCGDTTPHAKPHPAPLLEAARRLGVAAGECLYVGDDLRDVQAGRAAGMAHDRRRLGLPGQRTSRSRPGMPTPSSNARRALELLALA